MLAKLELVINGSHSLWLPAEGLDISLLKNEFNLLTSSTAENRPLSITETFEIPLDQNRRVFAELRGQKNTAELRYNDIVLIAGPITEYSVDEQRKKILVTITSAFKGVVDYMGDNVLYLDKIDLSRWNYTVGVFDKSQSNDLLRFGFYNPMDNDTGKIEFNQQNIDDYCKPSINLLAYFQEVFRLNGWTANWDAWTDTMRGVCLLPTTPYQCSSFGFHMPGTYTIPANGELALPLTIDNVAWNTTQDVLGTPTAGAEIIGDGTVQVRQPNRLMSFKVKALYKATEAFNIILREGANEVAYLQSLGDDAIGYTTDTTNLKDGLDPLSLVLVNPNPHDITVDFSTLDFYNLFSIYETNEDEFVAPQGYIFPVADNFPRMTALEVYREFLTLFQVAQTADDGTQDIDLYFINDIADKAFERVDVSPFLFWDGYTILSDKINGLAKLNAIRYKGDTKRSRYFRVDIGPLPASAVYFESAFAHGQTVRNWGAVSIPALKYKVKTTDDGISVEYLEWADVPPQLGYYDADTGAMTFNSLHITRIVEKYWSNILPFLSSFDGYNPVVYKLKLRLYYYQYLQLFGQRNLFYYEDNALLLGGTYDVINQTFEGTFVSLR
jgi:hypothetical protein